MKTIGEVIARLKECDGEKRVYFDFGYCIPTTVDSWRGIYAEPSLGWALAGYSGSVDKYPTVKDLVLELEKSLGILYSGWKGGKFKYHPDSPLHVDNPGDYTCTEIQRIEDSYNVIIHTATEERAWWDA